MRFLAVRRILWPVFRPKCHFFGHRMRLDASGCILCPARLREGGGMRWPPCHSEFFTPMCMQARSANFGFVENILQGDGCPIGPLTDK